MRLGGPDREEKKPRNNNDIVTPFPEDAVFQSPGMESSVCLAASRGCSIPSSPTGRTRWDQTEKNGIDNQCKGKSPTYLEKLEKCWNAKNAMPPTVLVPSLTDWMIM